MVNHAARDPAVRPRYYSPLSGPRCWTPLSDPTVRRQTPLSAVRLCCWIPLSDPATLCQTLRAHTCLVYLTFVRYSYG